MIQEHRTENARLFYDEGTPHIWKMDDNKRVEQWRFYSNDLTHGADAVKYPYTGNYGVIVFSIGKNGRHYTLRHYYRATTLNDVATQILPNMPHRFSEAANELSNLLNK